MEPGELKGPLFGANGARLVWDASSIACAMNDWVRFETEYNLGVQSPPSAEMICGSLWGDWRQSLALGEEGAERPLKYISKHEKYEELCKASFKKRNEGKACAEGLLVAMRAYMDEGVRLKLPAEAVEYRFDVSVGAAQSAAGEPFRLCGYLDMFEKDEEGRFIIRETKLNFSKHSSYWVQKLRHSIQMRTYELVGWKCALELGGMHASPMLCIDAMNLFREDGSVKATWTPTYFKVSPWRARLWELNLAVWLKIFEETAARSYTADGMRLPFNPEGQARWENVESTDLLIEAYRETSAIWAVKKMSSLTAGTSEARPWDPRMERKRRG